MSSLASVTTKAEEDLGVPICLREALLVSIRGVRVFPAKKVGQGEPRYRSNVR